ERDYGSVLRGALKQPSSKPKNKLPETESGQPRSTETSRRGTLHSFRQGIGSLLNAIGTKLGPSAHLGASVDSIEQVSSSPQVCRLRITENGHADSLDVRAVIISSDPAVAARVLGSISPQFDTLLNRIPFVPVTVVTTGYRASAIPQPLDGFGFLVPRKENLN